MKREEFIYLIYKEYRGLITVEEKNILDDWISASPENKKVKEDVLLSMDALDDYEPSFEVDLDEDFSELKGKMSIETHKTNDVKQTETKIFSMKRWMYVAASLVLVLGALAVMQFGMNGSAVMLSASTLDGERKEIQLSDGSKVWLNENSTLTYPSKFSKNKREISFSGEAFFDVAKNPNKSFEIRTAESLTSVLGTSFNIKEDNNDTYITVKTGKVKFEDLNSGSVTTLVAYEGANLNHDSRSIDKTVVEDLNNIAWQSNLLSFRNEPTKNVISFISEFFDVEINLDQADIENCRINMSKQEASLDLILSNIKKVNNVSIEKEGIKKYKILGGKC